MFRSRFPRPSIRPNACSRFVCQLVMLLLVFGWLGCAGGGTGPNANLPLRVIGSVDLARFDGLWYVVAHKPTGPEVGAYDETEHYALRADGSIDITTEFTLDGFDGETETLTMRGWVHDEVTQAEWRVQPFWPIRLRYMIIDLDVEYAWSVVGHPSKNYVWIMSRQPSLDPLILDGIRERLVESGYDLTTLRDVPQRPIGSRPERVGASER